MKNKIKISDTTAHATYAGGILTLDLPRALQPMLWRQEIKNISNVVFWVAHDNGNPALMMRLAIGTEQTIARFRDETTAEEALAAIREIFINVKPRKSFWGRVIKIIFWFLVIWVVGTFAIQLIVGLTLPKQLVTEQAAPTATATPAPTPTPPPAANNPAPTPPPPADH